MGDGLIVNDMIKNNANISGDKLNISSVITNINNDNMKGVIGKLTQDREKLILEIEKLQSHIMVLTEANKELTEELEAIVERDEKIGILLRRDEGLLATPGVSQD